MQARMHCPENLKGGNSDEGAKERNTALKGTGGNIF
jgi:hypothetical protein